MKLKKCLAGTAVAASLLLSGLAANAQEIITDPKPVSLESAIERFDQTRYQIKSTQTIPDVFNDRFYYPRRRESVNIHIPYYLISDIYMYQVPIYLKP